MAGTAITIRQHELMISLGQLGAAVSDVPDMLRIIGAYMMGSVARTFRDEGSPSGSWPALAASTKKKKGYTAGHKLLIMSGRLFGSIQSQVQGDRLTIGTNLVYAAVHQYGSRDRLGGSIGAQAKIPGRGVNVRQHFHSGRFRQFGTRTITDEFGDDENVRTRYQGPAQGMPISAHTRHQNIPARPYLVFRPEDPTNIELALESHIGARVSKAAVTP